MMDVSCAARYLQAGICVLPANLKEKRPSLARWKPFCGRLPTLRELEAWFKTPQPACAIAGGVSGNLELLDFDLHAELYGQWAEVVAKEDAGLLGRLVIETSQSGGRHVIYRSAEPVCGNRKLAQRIIAAKSGDTVVVGGKPFVPRKSGDRFEIICTLIETRGEGGLFLCSPTPGYQLCQGSFTDIPVLTPNERALLLEAACSLNEVIPTPEPLPDLCNGSQRPGDDFSQRGDFRSLLRRHGWTRIRSGENEQWRRPGKQLGCSATLKANTLFVFSSNAAPFEPDRAYSPFAAYALLEHGGDFSAAAAALRAEGFGSEVEEAKPARQAKNAPANVGKQHVPKTRRSKRKSGRSARNGSIERSSPGAEPIPGTIDPTTGRLILSTERTLPTAEAFVREFFQHPAGRTLHHYADLNMAWRDNRYVELEDNAMRHTLLPWLHDAVRMSYDQETDSFVPEDFPANPSTVKAALDSIKAFTHLPATISSPSWLGNAANQPDPRDIVPCRSSLLHLPTMATLPPTPAVFTVNAVEYDPEPQAPSPDHWYRFLEQLFSDDVQSWDLLQEWFGYCLTGDTAQHKMLLIVGPRRSGKGTLARVLTQLVGAGNVCGPTTSSLAGPFGLQPLIGKSLAIVSDARFSGENINTVVERLLCVSGEDSLTIDRKHMASVTMKLPTRFVFLTNELPRLSDASGALAGRFLMLRLTESFYGRENRELTQTLLSELPGILNWAIAGWRQLRERGAFIQPSCVEDTLRDMEDLSSPVGAFVRECCKVGPGLRVWVDELYFAWKQWCEQEGRSSVTTRQTFGRDLMAAIPGISSRRHRGCGRFYEGVELATGGGS